MGLLLTSLAYLTARIADEQSTVRRTLVWIGGIALLPCAGLAIALPTMTSVTAIIESLRSHPRLSRFSGSSPLPPTAALSAPSRPRHVDDEAPRQPNIGDWWSNQNWAYLSVRDNQLIGSAQGSGSGMWIHRHKNGAGAITALAEDFVLVFIPETFPMPTVHHDDQLWVEVTVPAKGFPRPIRLAIKTANGFTPLQFN